MNTVPFVSGKNGSVVLSDKENTKPTHHPKIMVASVREYEYALALKNEKELLEISYKYDVAEMMTAEEYITDKEAITKKGTLNRMYGKFRAKTVDLVNELFAELASLPE